MKNGDFCVALWPNNNTWYSAKIIEMRETSARVVFIDYLDLNLIPLTNIAHSMREVSSERLAITHLDQYMNQEEIESSQAVVDSPVRGYSTGHQLFDPTSPSKCYGTILKRREESRIYLEVEKERRIHMFKDIYPNHDKELPSLKLLEGVSTRGTVMYISPGSFFY